MNGQSALERARRRAWREWLRWTQEHRFRHLQEHLVLERVGEIDLIVLPGVFNPRLLRTGALLAAFVGEQAALTRCRVLDLGAGTGVCGLTAARLGATVDAVDIARQAVRCAQVNAVLNGLDRQVQVHHGDLFTPIRGRLYDRVIFNPPFWRGAPRSEADQAFRGLDVIERFASELPAALAVGGRAWLLLSSDGVLGETLAMLRRHGADVRAARSHDLGNEIVTIFDVAFGP